jgi:hypothetical protein
MSFMIAASVVKGAGMLKKRRSSKKAQKASKKIEDENVARARAETTEQIGRLTKMQEQTLGQTRARAGSSGVKSGSGTTDVYLQEMQKTFQEDIDWIEQSQASQESISRAEGKLERKQENARSWGSVANDTSSILSWWM